MKFDVGNTEDRGPDDHSWDCVEEDKDSTPSIIIQTDDEGSGDDQDLQTLEDDETNINEGATNIYRRIHLTPPPPVPVPDMSSVSPSPTADVIPSSRKVLFERKTTQAHLHTTRKVKLTSDRLHEKVLYVYLYFSSRSVSPPPDPLPFNRPFPEI